MSNCTFLFAKTIKKCIYLDKSFIHSLSGHIHTPIGVNYKEIIYNVDQLDIDWADDNEEYDIEHIRYHLCWTNKIFKFVLDNYKDTFFVLMSGCDPDPETLIKGHDWSKDLSYGTTEKSRTVWLDHFGQYTQIE